VTRENARTKQPAKAIPRDSRWSRLLPAATKLRFEKGPQATFSNLLGVSMRLDAISIGRNPPHEVNVIVEVPVGGEPIKYEMDKASGTLVVDRFLYTSMRYPGNYGFIPHTLSDDGDPCDVLIANQRGIVPGAIVAVRPVGVLKMKDEGGGDEKIIAVPVPRLTRRYEKVLNYTDLPDITVQQIEHFFQHYKDLETTKWVKVLGWGDSKEAESMILQAIERANQAK
jgi:inorganic pyrophosphatase